MLGGLSRGLRRVPVYQFDGTLAPRPTIPARAQNLRNYPFEHPKTAAAKTDTCKTFEGEVGWALDRFPKIPAMADAAPSRQNVM